jgi:hypothetical protein
MGIVADVGGLCEQRLQLRQRTKLKLDIQEGK